MHRGLLIIAACGLYGRSAHLAHGEENRTDLLAQCQPCMLIKSAFDPVFCFGLVFFSPCVPLLILFYLIDVHWGRLSLCGDHCVVWRRLNVYMHSFDFTQGSTGPSPGCSGSLSHMLSF